MSDLIIKGNEKADELAKKGAKTEGERVKVPKACDRLIFF